jgi:tetratricopeptide (TPR) repeat protein
LIINKGNMNELKEEKQKANELRKEGHYQEALFLYRKLWEQTRDKFDGTGLLHCLRKLELFDEALPFADELIREFIDFDWARNEAIWTYIHGIMGRFTESHPHEEILKTAEKIIELKPDNLATKLVIFKVLKSAKSFNNWQSVNEWVVKIEPSSLSAEPRKDELVRGGWSDQALWYNYRIRGLIEKGDKNKAIRIVDEIVDRFPKQRKYFMRLKALANHLIGNLSESENIYHDLCDGSMPDWWLLHEYARVVKDIGQREDALKLMYQAARGQGKLESKVSLLLDIGLLCKEMGKYQEARTHIFLYKCIREEKGWNIPEQVVEDISELNRTIGNDSVPSGLKEALRICQTEWSKTSGSIKEFRDYKRKVKNGLIGKVNLGPKDRPFCFIITKGKQSFFCNKSDLPAETIDGAQITFDAIPSFDKKKNQESWKAKNIRLFNDAEQ